ncbi:hypothetical protein, partial [Bifidobacterium magnum]
SHPLSRTQANKIGKLLKEVNQGDVAYSEIREQVSQWRAQHTYSTECCFKQLIDCSQSIHGAVASYRLKRLVSIEKKICRPHTNLRLGELDDIGGCRLIVPKVEDVFNIAHKLKERLTFKNGKSIKDYIHKPPQSGYRSLHLLARMPDSTGKSYRVEIQLRTQLEHLWSTAIEAVGEIYGTEYKSPETLINAAGKDQERLRFFLIISDLFALEEGTPRCLAEYATYDDLIFALRNINCLNRLIDDLEAASEGVWDIFESDSQKELHLLEFNRDQQTLEIRSYTMKDVGVALDEYKQMENQIISPKSTAGISPESQLNTVLAFAHSNEELQLAYPNYSANVRKFLDKIKTYL